jgi:predicted NACHT family NTPase
LERVPQEKLDGNPEEAADLMPLSRAREFLAQRFGESREESSGIPAVDQVRVRPRNVIVGAPGSGKSTFLEWFQLKISGAEQEFVLAGQQAIPLLLRVRQLDPEHLPADSAMIEKATASRDYATLMPPGWLRRQMFAGRVMFMLDGLDEVEPHVRDQRILPWFLRICDRFPECRFLVSSRPVGYPAGLLRKLGFSEAELLDFDEPQIQEYARHWCTAIASPAMKRWRKRAVKAKRMEIALCPASRDRPISRAWRETR